MIRLAAVIPAAGLSSRMGSFKPLLPLGDRTVVEQVVRLFTAEGVDPVIAVTGKRSDEVADAARRAGGDVVHNPGFEQGMFSSVLAGVESLPELVEAFFLLPADMPLIRQETVQLLVEEFDRTRPSILYPKFLGDRGHPPIISRSLIPEILAHDGEGGLRSVLERHDAEALDLEVADSGTLLDLDHPDDYELALSLYGRGHPTPGECEQLWLMAGGTRHVMEHCQAVSRVARALCEAFNEQCKATPLDVGLVLGAALTHDIGKGTKRHEEAGAELLKRHGFHAAADVVRIHFDTALGPDDALLEKDIVFLADKLVRCHRPVPLEERYLEKVKQYAHEPGAKQAILGRLERARALMARFDDEAGDSAERLAREALS